MSHRFLLTTIWVKDPHSVVEFVYTHHLYPSIMGMGRARSHSLFPSISLPKWSPKGGANEGRTTALPRNIALLYLNIYG
jgi:hypothetical protein